MTPLPSLHRLRQTLDPAEDARDRVRQDVMRRIRQPASADLLQRVRSLLQPSDALRLRLRAPVMNRLVSTPARFSYRFPKWVAAFALVLIGLRTGPLLFLAPQGIARSSVMILPTQGDVLLSLQGMWQPIAEEVELTEGVSIRTGNGEATILLHDDGTIRLAPHTTVTLHDVSDRPAPGIGSPTLTLTAGGIWLQGLLPVHLRGIEVVTPGGHVIVHRGSVSLVAEAERSTHMRVWDRTAVIVRDGEQRTLLAGEQITIGERSSHPIAPADYEDPWVKQNLDRDAVHQREIAQMQQERRASRAGILPTSALYPVKRVAEKVDVLLTFGADSRVRKQIDNASTRLDEAAALIAEGASGATTQLTEYREQLVAVASASGTDLARAMLDRELEEASADLAAALPADELYLLKRTVLETSAELSDGAIKEQDVESMLLVDSLNSLRQTIALGNTEDMRDIFDALQPSLNMLDLSEEDGGLPEDTRKEILALLADTAQSLQAQEAQESGTGTLIADVTEKLSSFLPDAAPQRAAPITPEEIDALLSGILTRIEIYDLPRSRYNQLQYELDRIKGHPAEGSILRRLLRGLEPELARYVRPAIEELSDRVKREE